MTTATGAHGTGALRRFAGFAPWLLPPCAFGLALPFIGRLLPPASSHPLVWLTDLAAHWQFAYAALWLALCLLAAFRSRRWLWCAPLSLSPLFGASASLPQAQAEVATAPMLTVAAANVHLGNRDPAALVAWLRQRPADVLVISELSPAYADAFSRAASDLFPYRLTHPEDSPFGIGIYARLPLSEADRLTGGGGVHALIAETVVDGRRARIVGLHPMPPMAPRWHAERDALLRVAATDARRIPTVVAGDLNATPWSTALFAAQDFGLSRTTGFAPTWPTHWAGWVGIPIDHVLASRHWHRLDAERGPPIGSDHFPVRVRLHKTSD